MLKLFGSIGNECRAKRVSVRTDQHVHRPDGLSCPFELCPYCSVFLSRLFIEVRDLECKNEFIEGLPVLLDMPALGYTVAKLRKGAGKNTDITDSARFNV